ncbi:type IV pilin-like G/H family protein [filamentous cyanobacterium LEGE 11480]|uniref:Type IV pilin-like G/H family protein n=1 Tax=Romeriopsis navalis LEGE 11480 TaxID=2777977 RepID=A0A928Z3Z9_9CYAN|nr:type IV pilin-like G/H family protein [Romeriopsis navalis]MBE9029795.1 type IV pilin-like G/H family protein [Romeriopsis navalis LEGE 11480]
MTNRLIRALLFGLTLALVGCRTSAPDTVVVKPDKVGQNRAANEAKTYIGSLNRAQQVAYLENQVFAPSLQALKMAVPPETTTYRYQVVAQADAVPGVINLATAKRPELPSFVGLVYVTDDQSGSETTVTKLCLATTEIKSMPVLPPVPSRIGAPIVCPENFEPV